MLWTTEYLKRPFFSLFFKVDERNPPYRCAAFTYLNSHKFSFKKEREKQLWKIIADVLTFAKSIFSVQQPEYMSAPCNVSFALVADSTESNVMTKTIS